MKSEDSLIEFPCDFQIKAIGHNKDTFATEIIELVRKHFPDTKDESFRSQPSQQGNYLAISITVYAVDKKTLDALYIELNKHPDTKMVL